jgi:hypothetical protein
MLTTLFLLGTVLPLAAVPEPVHAQTVEAGRTPRPARVIQRSMLRLAPRSGARALRSLNVDEEVMLRERRAGWSRVSTKDATGWVTSVSLANTRPRQQSKSEPAESAAAVVPAQPMEAPRAGNDPAQAAPDVGIPQANVAARTQNEAVATQQFTLGGRVWMESGITPVGVVVERRLGDPVRALGNAWVGVAASADVVSGAEDGFRYTFVLGGIMANVHGTLPGAPRLDPFVGVGAMYGYVRASGDFDLGDGTTTRISTGVGSGAFVVGNVGTRVYLTRQLAAYGAYTFGRQLTGQLSLGMTWRP